MWWFMVLGWSFTLTCILGNSFVAYLISTRPRLHVKANWFVLSLALADLCVGSSYLPLLISSSFFQTFTSDHKGLWFKVSHTFIHSSTTNLCVLTADRFTAITMPLRYVLYMTQRRIYCLVAFAWVLPITFFTLPSFFIYSNEQDSLTFAFETIRVVIFQLIPSVLFIFVAGRLFYIAKGISRKEEFTLTQIRFNLPPLQKNARRNSRDERKPSSIKMLILIIFIFVLCHVGGNYRCFCSVFNLCVVPDCIRKVIELLFVFNSAINPLVYAFLKKDIKREMKLMGRGFKTGTVLIT